jgi:hypothetical protein
MLSFLTVWITEMTGGLLLLMKKDIEIGIMREREFGTTCTGLNRSAHDYLCSYAYDSAVLIFFWPSQGRVTVHGGFTQVREFLGHLPNRLKHRGPRI